MPKHVLVTFAFALLLAACTSPGLPPAVQSLAAWEETRIQNTASHQNSSRGFDDLLAPGLWSTAPTISGNVSDITNGDGATFTLDFDSLVAESEFNALDGAYFSIELDKGGVTEHWSMQMRILRPKATGTASGQSGELEFSTNATIGERNFTYKSRLFDAEVLLWDDRGKLLGTTELQVPHLISAGMLDLSLLIDGSVLIEAMSNGEALPAGVARKMGHSFSTLVSLFALIQENDLFADLMWEAVQKPSILSVVKNFGVVLSLSPKFKDQVKLPPPGPGTPWHNLSDEPHFALPIEVSANGTLAATIDLYITTPRPPLAICGGILSLVTHHPTKDITLRMNLIGAHMAASGDKSAPE